jgi:hypothetical protein
MVYFPEQDLCIVMSYYSTMMSGAFQCRSGRINSLGHIVIKFKITVNRS